MSPNEIFDVKTSRLVLENTRNAKLYTVGTLVQFNILMCYNPLRVLMLYYHFQFVHPSNIYHEKINLLSLSLIFFLSQPFLLRRSTRIIGCVISANTLL